MWMLVVLLGCSNLGSVEPPGGDPTRFDPIGRYAEVAAFAGPGSQITSFDANGIRADGTVDVTTDLYFSVRYTFVREVPAPADAPPVGAGGSPDGRYHERIDVNVSRPGMRTVAANGSSQDYRFLGMEKNVSTLPGAPEWVLPAPACTLATLWKGLAAAGAPAGAVAFVHYGSDGWDLYVADTTARASYGTDCVATGGSMPTPAAPAAAVDPPAITPPAEEAP